MGLCHHQPRFLLFGLIVLIAAALLLGRVCYSLYAYSTAIKTFVNQLSQNNRVGIIVFHDDFDIISPFTTLMDTLKSQVDSIKAFGDYIMVASVAIFLIIELTSLFVNLFNLNIG